MFPKAISLGWVNLPFTKNSEKKTNMDIKDASFNSKHVTFSNQQNILVHLSFYKILKDIYLHYTFKQIRGGRREIKYWEIEFKIMVGHYLYKPSYAYQDTETVIHIS